MVGVVVTAEVAGLISSATEIRSGVFSPTPSPEGIQVFVVMVEDVLVQPICVVGLANETK